MPRRAGPRAAEAFAARLIELRRKRKLDAIAKLMKRQGLEINPSTLHRYEKGRHLPTPDVLLVLAKVYEQPFDEFLTLALSDLLGPGQQLQLTSNQEGGAVDPAVAARILDLERDLAEQETAHAAQLREIQNVVFRLTRLVAGEEDGTATGTAAKSRGRGRKARG